MCLAQAVCRLCLPDDCTKKRSALPTKVLTQAISPLLVTLTLESTLTMGPIIWLFDVVCCYISRLKMYRHSEIRLHI